MGKKGEYRLRAAQFSAARTSLERKEGNPECTGRGKNGCYCCVSRARLYSLFWHTFPDTKPMFPPQKYSLILLTTAYETSFSKDARLHAIGLEILWRISQK